MGNFAHDPATTSSTSAWNSEPPVKIVGAESPAPGLGLEESIFSLARGGPAAAKTMVARLELWKGLIVSSVVAFTGLSHGLRRSAMQMVWKAGESDQKFLIAPSILSANFARLGEEVDNVLAAGADVVHFDVMDNHYVPNLTIGPMVCKALRDHGVTKDIDVHLMVEPVDAMIQDFAAAGATYITFHPEASKHVDRSLGLIRSLGCKAGLVLTPSTSLDYCKYVMDKLDIILLMSVNPGFGGQSFIPATLDKLKEARAMIDASGYDIRLQVDGGVTVANIRGIAEAGADMFVAGSAILKNPRTKDAYETTITNMRESLKGL